MEELIQYGNIATAIVPIYGTTGHALTATAVDATGFSRVCFMIQTGAMQALCKIEMSATESATSTGTYTKISGAELTDIASTAGASKVYIIDVPVSGSKPYLKLRGTCGTARGYASAVAYLYRGSGIQPNTDGYTQYVHV